MAISIMKLARIVEVSIMMSSVLICVVMIGSIHLVNERSITSVEYMSLKELVAIVHGISIEIGEVITILIITSSMIYLANADQLHKHNTMMKVSLVHNKWSTR